MAIESGQLEILIGRFIDGEISPDERQVLERELEANSQARELLEQLRGLRQHSCKVVAAEVSGGASADQIFEQAWQRHTRPSYPRIIRMDRHLRFVIGLAAGLILGLALHFVAVNFRTPVQSPESPKVAQMIPNEVDPGLIIPATVTSAVSRPVTGEVDWFVFTSPSGEQWLVQGIREGQARTTSARNKPRAM